MILDRLLNFLPWALATLMIAAMVHLISVLLMPALAPKDAYARLASYAKTVGINEGVVALPPITPGAEILPLKMHHLWRQPASMIFPGVPIM